MNGGIAYVLGMHGENVPQLLVLLEQDGRFRSPRKSMQLRILGLVHIVWRAFKETQNVCVWNHVFKLGNGCARIVWLTNAFAQGSIVGDREPRIDVDLRRLHKELDII